VGGGGGKCHVVQGCGSIAAEGDLWDIAVKEKRRALEGESEGNNLLDTEWEREL